MIDRSNDSLEAGLAKLRGYDDAGALLRISARLDSQIRSRRRDVAVSLLGTGVAAVGAVLLLARGEAVAFVVGIAAAAMLYAAIASARETARLSAADSGRSLLASWRSELTRQIRHVHLSAACALGFLGLTGWVVARHGLEYWRALVYLAACLVVIAYAGYQRLVVLPVLTREKTLLGEND